MFNCCFAETRNFQSLQVHDLELEHILPVRPCCAVVPASALLDGVRLVVDNLEDYLCDLPVADKHLASLVAGPVSDGEIEFADLAASVGGVLRTSPRPSLNLPLLGTSVSGSLRTSTRPSLNLLIPCAHV
jgi:hypothetical protein